MPMFHARTFQNASLTTICLLLLMAGRTRAASVTFYTDEVSFLAAISNPTVHDFEGIVAPELNSFLGPAYHTGAVTFTSPGIVSPNRVVIVGKDSPTLGVPFDSALLIPDTFPSPMHATFDPGSDVTAVGGYFLNLFGDPIPGTLTLTGSSGQLDSRGVTLGVATSGSLKTFFGYVVTGDTISKLVVNPSEHTVAFDNFTYAAVPEPAGIAMLGIPMAGLLVRRRKSRRAVAL
jgi:hypothetical protein